MTFRRGGMLLCLVGLLAGWPGGLRADHPSSRASEIRAGFLYKFAQLVDWPEHDSSRAFVYCVFGDGKFGDLLAENLAGRSVVGRAIEVHRALEPSAQRCDITFFSHLRREAIEHSLGEISDRSLTIAEVDDFLEHGGMINLLQRAGKLKFEVNLEAARAASLKLDARLLALATRVLEGSAGDR